MHPSLFLLAVMKLYADLHLVCFLFQLSLSLLEDRLYTSVFLFGGCFAMLQLLLKLEEKLLYCRGLSLAVGA